MDEYESYSEDELDEMDQKAISDAANQRAFRAGIDAAANMNGVVGAVGKGLKVADNLTDGDVSKKGGELAKKLNVGNSFAQGLNNKLANSDLAKKAADAYQAKNANKGNNDTAKAKDKAAERAAEAKGPKDAENQLKKGGDDKESLPSSDGKNNLPNHNKVGNDSSFDNNQDDKDKDNSEKDKSNSDDKDEESKGKTATNLLATAAGVKGILLPLTVIFLPLFLGVFLVLILATTIDGIVDYAEAITASVASGNYAGGLEADVDDPVKQAFAERIAMVVGKFQENGMTVDPVMIVAVYRTLNSYDSNITYETMDATKITLIANAMFENNVYDETGFITKLRNEIIPSYIPDLDDETKNEMISKMFNYVDEYYSFIGVDSATTCISDGKCTYNIKGFYINGSNYKKEINVNNLYVRLMQCGSYDKYNAGGQWGEPLEGEDLIPFEKYILGVAYNKMGSDASAEAFKTQMVAARSFILARPTQLGSSAKGRSLENKDGKWILQVASCSADQVYCDPDNGCSSVTGESIGEQIYSGTYYGKKIKDALAADSPLRKYATETQGVVLVNKDGYIVSTGYTDEDSNKFTSLANQGLDYKQILVQVYSKKYPNVGSLSLDKAKCNVCENNTEYINWKQSSSEWGAIPLGSSKATIKTAGCLVTSLAIQVARSGVQTNISGEFNPGTFVQSMNKIGAFDGSGSFVSYANVQKVAPKFKYENVISLAGKSKQDKLNTIKSVVNQNGVYAIAEVKGGSPNQHWVAIDSVNGNTINMFDPGSKATDMWKEYNWANTSRIVYYRVS